MKMKCNWEQTLVKNPSTTEIDHWLIITCSKMGGKCIPQISREAGWLNRTLLKREAVRLETEWDESHSRRDNGKA